MMTAIASGALADTPAAKTHLDHCLSCRACESVCPAKVPYLQLLDAHRAAHPPRFRPLNALLGAALSLRRLRPVLRFFLRGLTRARPALLGLSRALRWRKLKRLSSLLPSGPARCPPPRVPNADLQLFVGCLGDLANGDAIQGFVACCDALGLKVDTIAAGHCCGALAQHRGAARRSQDQLSALAHQRHSALPLVGLDSACVSQLRDAGWDQVHEACAFLAAQDWQAVRLAPLARTLLIHEPCTQRNGLREHGAARALLGKIPQLQLASIADPHCCGAAGLHMLDFPQRADALLAPKLAEFKASTASHLTTTNIGCALHLAGGLRREGLREPRSMPTVVHPTEIMAAQIDAQ